MENWGLVIYPDRLLLFDPTIHSEMRKIKISGVMAHEIAHQWFGNFISFKWWSYLWLGEGFARFFESFILDLVRCYLLFKCYNSFECEF